MVLSPPLLRGQLVDREGYCTLPWQQWFDELWRRVGMAEAPTPTDLRSQEYLVGQGSTVLTNERLVTDTATIGWDLTVPGQVQVDILSVPAHPHMAADITDFTEASQDAVGALLTDTATIDLTYDDALGQVRAAVQPDSITFGLFQNIPSDRLLGRSTAGSGNMEELLVGSGLRLSGGTLSSAHGGYLLQCPGFHAVNLTTQLTLPNNTALALYLGMCPKASSSLSVRYNVTAGASTLVYGEVGIFRGHPGPANAPTLERLGVTIADTDLGSTGVKDLPVTLSPAAQVGDTLWVVFGGQATTPARLRAGLADDLQSGWYASLSGRPSTVSSPATWTVASATLELPWCTVLVT